MIYGFDWDGTLVASFGSDPMPGAAAALRALPADAHTFIATNQAGPVFRAVTGSKRYPTVETVCANIRAGLTALDWRPDLFLLCCHSGKTGGAWQGAAHNVAEDFHGQLVAGLGTIPYATFLGATFRKPQPHMLLYAAGHFKTQIGDLLYIGDREDDKTAAKRAGCRFVDAADWVKDANL